MEKESIEYYVIRECEVVYKSFKRLKKSPDCGSSKEVYSVFKKDLMKMGVEVFIAVFMTGTNNIKAVYRNSEGGITSTYVSVNKVLKTGHMVEASSMILLHNHPSGNIEPSENDKRITELFVNAGRLMEIKVIDHIIVGENKYFSFADSGLIKRYESSRMSIAEIVNEAITERLNLKKNEGKS